MGITGAMLEAAHQLGHPRCFLPMFWSFVVAERALTAFVQFGVISNSPLPRALWVFGADHSLQVCIS